MAWKGFVALNLSALLRLKLNLLMFVYLFCIVGTIGRNLLYLLVLLLGHHIHQVLQKSLNWILRQWTHPTTILFLHIQETLDSNDKLSLEQTIHQIQVIYNLTSELLYSSQSTNLNSVSDRLFLYPVFEHSNWFLRSRLL